MPKLPKTLHGVLFDLDGVLVDSAPAWHRVIDEGARQSGHPGVSFERFIGTFGQGVDADRRNFFPSLTNAEVDALYLERFASHLDALRVMEGAHLLLDRLGAAGIARAVVTNTPRLLADKVLAHAQLSARLESSSAGGEAAEKPSPKLVELALKRLSLSAKDVIYVGDSQSDRGAARAAGIFMVGLGIEGDARIEHLSELEGVLGSLLPLG
ncbi:MAG: HAD family hydrolase [Deltaproteobacteria bacterium]|nr:HAD family hydrolase [Deltaproteobacteria bacterium]